MEVLLTESRKEVRNFALIGVKHVTDAINAGNDELEEEHLIDLVLWRAIARATKSAQVPCRVTIRWRQDIEMVKENFQTAMDTDAHLRSGADRLLEDDDWRNTEATHARILMACLKSLTTRGRYTVAELTLVFAK